MDGALTLQKCWRFWLLNVLGGKEYLVAAPLYRPSYMPSHISPQDPLSDCYTLRLDLFRLCRQPAATRLTLSYAVALWALLSTAYVRTRPNSTVQKNRWQEASTGAQEMHHTHWSGRFLRLCQIHPRVIWVTATSVTFQLMSVWFPGDEITSVTFSSNSSKANLDVGEENVVKVVFLFGYAWLCFCVSVVRSQIHWPRPASGLSWPLPGVKYKHTVQLLLFITMTKMCFVIWPHCWGKVLPSFVLREASGEHPYQSLLFDCKNTHTQISQRPALSWNEFMIVQAVSAPAKFRFTMWTLPHLG